MRKTSGSIGLLITVVGVTFAGLVSLSLASLRSVASPLPVYDQLGGDFKLQSTQDVNSLSDVQGQVALLSFGFTSCTDICSMMVDKMAKVYREMDRRKLDKKVAMFFVTVDPERDSLQVMEEYIDHFDSRIVGLTGESHAIQQTQKNLAVLAYPITGEDQWVHSDRIFLFDPQGRLRAMVSLVDPVSEMVTMIEGLLVEAR